MSEVSLITASSRSLLHQARLVSGSGPNHEEDILDVLLQQFLIRFRIFFWGTRPRPSNRGKSFRMRKLRRTRHTYKSATWILLGALFFPADGRRFLLFKTRRLISRVELFLHHPGPRMYRLGEVLSFRIPFPPSSSLGLNHPSSDSGIRPAVCWDTLKHPCH